ncbi:hypothetical protein AVEN_40803-1 [Araneus ventricosus]|uniref:Uncharacterized protein n=1 Tax=Araneus ventricosus TaxID=182803 RepID=A0A4Y2CG54_ARAVE|nr:hypothetical protein AVEN_40803-1 [Araneus ventricosus]
MSAINGPRVIFRPTIVKWCKKFGEGRTNLADAERLVRAIMSTTTDLVHLLNGMIIKNHKLTVTTDRFYVFDKMKEHLEGRQFANDDQVKTALKTRQD